MNEFKWHPASELPAESNYYLVYVNWRRVSDDGLRVEDDYRYDIDKFNVYYKYWVKSRKNELIAWAAIPEVDIHE